MMVAQDGAIMPLLAASSGGAAEPLPQLHASLVDDLCWDAELTQAAWDVSSVDNQLHVATKPGHEALVAALIGAGASTPPTTVAVVPKPAGPSPSKKRKKRDFCVGSDNGGDFVDKNGKVFSYENQKKRARTWICDSWRKQTQVHVKMHYLWMRHGDGIFSKKELQYKDPKTNKTRYISVKGLCNGHEVSGFPILHPVDIKGDSIVSVRFSKPVREVLQAEHPRQVTSVNQDL
jgi:hypothetical protein